MGVLRDKPEALLPADGKLPKQFKITRSHTLARNRGNVVISANKLVEEFYRDILQVIRAPKKLTPSKELTEPHSRPVWDTGAVSNGRVVVLFGGRSEIGLEVAARIAAGATVILAARRQKILLISANGSNPSMRLQSTQSNSMPNDTSSA